jgi:tetratricopeptide (TPR) repeat protein
MSDDTVTIDEIEELVSYSERLLEGGSHDEAWRLADQARNASSASTEQQARAAIVLAGAALRNGSTVEARSWLADAESLGASSESISTVRGDLARLEEAEGAIGGGLDQADEFQSVLTAARNALADGAPDQAEQLLTAIWDTTGVDNSVLAEAGYLLAKAHLDRGRVDDARQWAEWARDNGYAGAREILDDIGRLEQAYQATEDGIVPAEQRATWEAATEAFSRQDYATARDLYYAVYESPILRAEQRGGCAFNIAQCNRLTADFEIARSWYEEYLRLAPSSEYAAEVHQKLDQLDTLIGLDMVLGLD